MKRTALRKTQAAASSSAGQIPPLRRLWIDVCRSFAVNEPFWIGLIGATLTFAILYVFLEQHFLSASAWNSGQLQVLAWFEGRMDIGRMYEHLEIATYEGKYFISFPPVPAVMMVPWVWFYKAAPVPTNTLNTIYALLGFVASYWFARRYKSTAWEACFLAGFAVFGSNLLFMAVSGGPWFQAQVLAYTFMICAFWQVSLGTPKGIFLGLTALGLAVGCRPFQIFFLPVLLYMAWKPKGRQDSLSSAGQLGLQSAGMVAIFLALAAYNYARFSNPFEFGHNYLHEFLNSEDGQFSLKYLLPNLQKALRWPVFPGGKGITLERFDGYLFVIANPFLGIFCWRACQSIWQRKAPSTLDLLVIAGILGEGLLLLSHKTLGGWQFGLRYFVDLIPAALFFVLNHRPVLGTYEKLIGVLAIVWNLCGTLWFFQGAP